MTMIRVRCQGAMPCLLLAMLLLIGEGAAGAFLPSKTLAKNLDPYWFGVFHRAIWALKDDQLFKEFDDLTRELVRFRRQEERLDRTCIRDGEQQEMRHGIDRCYEEMQKRSTRVWVSLGQIHDVGRQIANGRFSAADRKIGRQLMALTDQLAWLWQRTIVEATLTRSIVDYPETAVRATWRSRLNDLFSFYYRFIHLRGEPIKVLRERP
ncbi:MAG: hypothetical protein OZSIB_1490 [Candidatus Ozemobacter sibiricus]|uniref:Uncharacterized protein n=1 Tax=Candidatus Ozemobacter sibiricus TaxID=2268124 RepID=A0A367ZK04_9BACT|nr:MAG: hypothetical protein OZSIB_1490 [Candidatus Ozemobacter sibiricus]